MRDFLFYYYWLFGGDNMGEDKSRQNNKPKKQPSQPLGIEPETVFVTKSADKSKMQTKRLII